jgi:hypothetical protein
VVSAIGRIEIEMGWRVERIALDAPAAAPERGSRAPETELGRHGLSFRTPARGAWAAIRKQCAEHIKQGGTPASLPHANKIWMLFGFALFAQLRNDLQAEVIEVYPFAIIRELLPKCQHKSTEKGYRDQLYAVAARTGWDDPAKLEASLKAMVPGSRHILSAVVPMTVCSCWFGTIAELRTRCRVRAATLYERHTILTDVRARPCSSCLRAGAGAPAADSR